jgi:hypothetical protein
LGLALLDCIPNEGLLEALQNLEDIRRFHAEIAEISKMALAEGTSSRRIGATRSNRQPHSLGFDPY